MDRKFVESLGWEYACLWNNRDFYQFHGLQIMEHNGSWSITRGEDNYFIEDVGEEMLTEYTNLVKKFCEIYDDPENHTLAEYNKAVKAIKDFYDKYGYNEEEDFEL